MAWLETCVRKQKSPIGVVLDVDAHEDNAMTHVNLVDPVTKELRACVDLVPQERLALIEMLKRASPDEYVPGFLPDHRWRG